MILQRISSSMVWALLALCALWPMCRGQGVSSAGSRDITSICIIMRDVHNHVQIWADAGKNMSTHNSRPQL